jgi:hypothetical protein
MIKYSLIKNDEVINIIKTDESNEGALSFLFPEYDKIIKETSETGNSEVGYLYKKEKFFPGCQYKSWEFNEDLETWVPPVKPPIDESTIYYWNEGALSWSK